MEPFLKLEGTAAPLRLVNVDTDMIIPKQYLKLITRSGLAKGLLIEKRLLNDGSPDPDFTLNQARYQGASVLIAGDNFGCGSSREQAVWALMDAGFRCVISTSFGDIFHNNCFKNGLLPIRVSDAVLSELFRHAEEADPAQITVSLEDNEIRIPGADPIQFTIDAYQRELLLKGLDEVALTLKRESAIAAFEAKRKASSPWIFNANGENAVENA